MSFYITLLSDQAQGTGQKFTARLPRSHYLVEDDWEVALCISPTRGLINPWKIKPSRMGRKKIVKNIG